MHFKTNKPRPSAKIGGAKIFPEKNPSFPFAVSLQRRTFAILKKDMGTINEYKDFNEFSEDSKEETTTTAVCSSTRKRTAS